MPTHLIRRYLDELGRWLRNQQEYDDFPYGMEPISHDRTWVKTDNNCNDEPEAAKEED